MQTNKRNKVRLALTGPALAPKLFTALQIAHGLSGHWQRIIVLGSSVKDGQYQHLGPYEVYNLPLDAPPQRYTALLNLCGGSAKDVIIFSGFSNEWQEGVTGYTNTGLYDEVLKAHHHFFAVVAGSPVHIIACVETKKKLLFGEGSRKFRFINIPVQQEGFERHFTCVLSVNKQGMARAQKDATKTLPVDGAFKPSLQTGAALQDWCAGGSPVVSRQIQQCINRCNNLAELYRLLFELELEDSEIISAFTQRRLELEAVSDEKLREYEREAELRAIQGGLHE